MGERTVPAENCEMPYLVLISIEADLTLSPSQGWPLKYFYAGELADSPKMRKQNRMPTILNVRARIQPARAKAKVTTSSIAFLKPGHGLGRVS